MDRHDKHREAHVGELSAIGMLPIPTERPRLADPWWRKPLVWLGLAKPRYGMSMQDYLDHMQAHIEALSGLNSVARGETRATQDPNHTGEL